MKKLLPVLLLLFLLAGCGAQESSVSFYAMDTTMKLTLYGAGGAETILADSESELQRLESAFSRTIDTSLVSRLNRGETVTDSELASLLRECIRCTAGTGGAFDVTIAPVVSAWGFTTDTYQVPDADTLAGLLTHVGSDGILLDGDTISLAADVGIDLGGVAKGYASDRIAALWKDAGVVSGLAALGGNIYCCGTKPDGSQWSIAVRDPNDESAYVGTLSLSDAFAVTSGGYERYFVQDGVTYHHIIDPSTGYPAESGLLSVTIVSPEKGTDCDIYSTACYVMGADAAVDFWRKTGGFEMILVTDDGRVLITEGLEKSFDASSAVHEYDYEILR